MKLSIILPVYNVARFIPDCLDSLLCQDIAKDDYEIICVDDGSPDNSTEVIKGYAKLYSNIKLISQPNSGVCVARNNGFENAKGKYTWFVDPDDYIAPNCLGKLVSALDENNADLITFDYFNVEEESSFKEVKASEIKIEPQVGYRAKGGGWQYICRRQYLIDNAIIYNKDLAYGEDYLWAFQINYRKHVGLETKSEVYYYRQRQGSAMHSKTEQRKKRYIEDLQKLALIYVDEYNRCKEEQFPAKILKAIKRRRYIAVQSAIWGLITFAKSKEEVVFNLDRMKQQGIYPYPWTWWNLFTKRIQCRWLLKVLMLPTPVKGYVVFLNCLYRKINKKSCST